MGNAFAASLAALAFAGLLWPALVSGQPAVRTAPPEIPTDRVIVKWKKQAAPERRVERLSQRTGVSLVQHRAMSGGAQVLKLDRRRDRGEARAIAARLAQDPEVEYAVPDQKRFPFATPTDGYFTGGLQSNLTSMNVHFAWDVTTGSPALVVAVIDTGILAQHPDLDPARILPGRDFVSDTYAANDGSARDAAADDPGDWVSWADVEDPSSPFDSACLYGGVYDTYSSWHGTHMAGIIGAATNNGNGNGIAGINWSSKLLPVRVLGKCGGYDSDIIDGMRWAAGLAVPGAPDNPTPARVLNLSLGGFGACNAAWQSAIDQVTALDKVVVVAAGNEGVDFAGVAPASCQGVIAVAAHDAFGQRSFYSNFATAPAPNLFSAPGDNIYSTSDGGLQAPANDGMLYPEYGTSGAAAQVSGIVSLMLSANPALTNAEVLQLLRESSTALGTWAGSGRIDALQAVGNSLAFHGVAPVPVSVSIGGPAEVFENTGGHFYTATVTWSDAAVTLAYPRWSLTAAFAPQATMTSTGLLPEFSVGADAIAAVHASFTANGVTVTADKDVLVKDNYVTSIVASGPATVYLNNPAPAKFSATATWRDGRVLGGDVTWSVFSGMGSISSAGLFFAGAEGPVTVRATLGALTSDAITEVVPGAPAPGAITLDCPVESVAGFAPDQLFSLKVGAGADVIPLCNGKVVVTDRPGQRVDVIDIATGTVARSWSVVPPAVPSAQINRMELAAGSSKIFMSFFGAGAGLASIDLANPDDPPQYIPLPAPYAANHAGMLASGDPGQIWVMHSQFDMFNGLVKLSRYQVSDGALLGTHDLPRTGNFMQYSRTGRILVTTLALSGGGRTAYDVSPAYALTEREFSSQSGVLTAISPDGTRVLYRGMDLDVADLDSSRGTWRGAEAAGFSPDGKLLAGNDTGGSGGTEFAIYATERHLKLKGYPREDICIHLSTRFSPSGAFVYGYALCNSDNTGQLFGVALGGLPSPDPIAFEGQTGAAPGGLVESGAVVLSGFAGSAGIEVAGGEYRINGGGFTSAPGTAVAGDSVVVRVQASAEPYATAVASLQVGATAAEFRVTTGAALPVQWWDAACPAEEEDLGAAAMAFADMDPAWDVLALCDGRVLIGNRQQNRVELYDVRARAAVKTWLLNAAPEVLRRVPGTSTLLVVTDSSYVESVDLDSGAVQRLSVGGRPWDVFAGEPGQMIAVRDSFPTFDTRNGDRISFHDLATGALLASTDLQVHAHASHVRYDSTTKNLWTGNKWNSPARIARYSYDPATHAITEQAIQPHDGAASYMAELVLSPDRALIASPYHSLPTGVTTDMMGYDAAGLGLAKRFPSGPNARAADFRADSAKLVIANAPATTHVSAIAIYDVATLALERSWIVAHCPDLLRNMRRVRYSPSGKYVYALETCGGGDGDSARLLWVPTAAASTMPQPDPVAFVPQSGVALNADTTSNEITITGLQGLSVPISIDGMSGQYSVFGGAFRTAAPGRVSDGDRVRVHQTAWFDPGVTTTVTLNIGGTLLEFKVTTGGAPGTDTMPDPFRLVVLKNRPLDTEFVSNTVAITGIDAPAPISVAGGAYSIDGGAYTSAAGTVTNGQLVTVKLTSANTVSTAGMALLTVGGYSTGLSVTTADTDTTPDAFAFPPRPRVPRNTWIESAPVTIGGLGGVATVSVAGGEYRVGAGSYTAAVGGVDNGDVVRVRVMSSATLGETRSATLTIGPRSADFSVTTGAAVRTDLGADGRSDVLWRNAVSGENYLYPMEGTTILGTEGYLRTVADLNWKVAGVGDFDGDGRADILWRNASSGENYVYFMNGTAIANEGYLRTVADQSWQVAGIGDFDGDGRDDVLWRHALSGENYLYPMDGLSIKPSEGYLRTVADTSWAVAGVGDLDGDGRADIVWRNASSGENYAYLLNGTTIASEGYLRTVADATWQIAGVGDFDGDGRADILWRNSVSGENYLYPMNGTAILGTEGYLRTVADTSWQVKGTGDYDGDAKADILWRNAVSGENYLYPMDGTAIKPTEGYIRTVPPPDWQVQ